MMTSLLWRLVAFNLLAATQQHASVESPPSILIQPPNEELLFMVRNHPYANPKPFIIECEAEGSPSPEYRWEKDGKLFEWQAFDTKINQPPGKGSLIFLDPEPQDAGTYVCYASNRLGTAVTNTAVLREATLNDFEKKDIQVVTVKEGNPLDIKCNMPGGWPTPTIQWMIVRTNGALKTINSTRLTIDPDGYLHFSNVTRMDASQEFFYACTASSYFRYEYKVGNYIKLQVIKPNITGGMQPNKIGPTRQYVTGEKHIAFKALTTRLWCVFGGSPLPKIKWTKANGSIPKDRAYYENFGKTLVIDDIDYEDEGNYSCEVSNEVGIPQTHTIQVTVYATPYFIKEPENQLKYEGEDVIFECVAGGFPNPKISWVHNGMSIDRVSPNPRRTVNSRFIIIKNLTREDSGNYGCNATALNKYVYKDVFINVLPLGPAQVQVSPLFTHNVIGSNVTFTCNTSGKPNPLVQWFKDSIKVTGNRFMITTDDSLIIFNITIEDAGVYTCNATNKFGSVVSSGQLVVNVEPVKVEMTPLFTRNVTGSNVTFTCKTAGKPKPIVHWFKDNIKVNGNQFFITTDGNLIISQITSKDAGVYTCNATNMFGSVVKSGQLVVFKKPTRITQRPQSLEVESGKRATLSCLAVIDESLDLTINWLKDGQQIDFAVQPRYFLTDNSFTIFDSKEIDTGNYTCEASTNLDKDVATASLVVFSTIKSTLLDWSESIFHQFYNYTKTMIVAVFDKF